MAAWADRLRSLEFNVVELSARPKNSATSRRVSIRCELPSENTLRACGPQVRRSPSGACQRPHPGANSLNIDGVDWTWQGTMPARQGICFAAATRFIHLLWARERQERTVCCGLTWDRRRSDRVRPGAVERGREQNFAEVDIDTQDGCTQYRNFSAGAILVTKDLRSGLRLDHVMGFGSH
jgi:hypothetical protein